MERTPVEFDTEGGVTLRGWLYLPDDSSPRPGITMAHGFAATCEHGLDPFARTFADAGFAVLIHNHRGFNDPRYRLDAANEVALRHGFSSLGDVVISSCVG